MTSELKTVVVSVLAAAPAGAQELHAVDHPASADEVPHGAREDQLLWKAARDATVEAMHQIALANQEIYELGYARLDLDQLEKDAKGDDVAKLRAIRARLDEPAKALDAVIPRGPTGRCRYVLLHLE